MPARYVLIAGHGRSGTNWLLQLLDRASETHCRNEPDEIGGNAFERLPSPWVPVPDERAASFSEPWGRAVVEAGARMGERDRAPAVPKRHVPPWVAGTHLVDALARPRVRRVLAAAVPAWRGREWPRPGRRAAAGEPLVVLKCNQVPGWARWVLEHDPSGRVLHIVRHPGGFLSSWRRRYVGERDEARVLAENRHRLALVAQASPAFAAKMGDVDALDLDHSELWFWRYAVETIDEAGVRATGRYHRVAFEALAREPVAHARAIFAWLGLAWTPAIERAVEAMSRESLGIVARAAGDLSAHQRAAIARVLEGSALHGWWSEPEASGAEPSQRGEAR